MNKGAEPDAVIIVGNTPEYLPPLESSGDAPADIADWKGRPLVVFLGNLLADRGLHQAIRAIAVAREEVPDIGLMIIGDGPEYGGLLARVEADELADNVRLLGWKKFTEHAAYYDVASVGILPFLATPHIEITLANKLFDYMAASLAVIASDVPPMRRVLEETEAGVLVRPGDPEALGRAFIDLFSDPERICALGNRGRAAVSGPYNWAADRERFLNAVERVHRGA